MPKILKPYYDFRGGINTDAAPDNLLDNELEVADNAVMAERGGLKKRFGTVAINETSYGDPVEQLIEWPRDDGSTVLLAVIGGNLCEVDEEDGSLTVVQTVESSRVGHFFLQDKFYFVDGDEFYVYDGTNVEVVRPRVYLETVTGGPFEEGETITGGTSTATATVDVVGDGYLGLSNVSGEFEENETITGDSSGASASISGIDEGVASDNALDQIRRCKYLVRHTNSFRIFAAGDSDTQSAIYYSEANEPTYFKNTSVLFPTTADGPVKGIKAFGEALVAFFENSAWVWHGVDPASDATWKRIPMGVGTVNEASVALTPNSLTMLGPGGLYAISPSILGFDATIIPGEGMVKNLATDKFTRLIQSIANPDNVAAVYDALNERYMLAYSDNILVYDWELGAITRWTNLPILDFCYRLNHELWAATLDGYIIRMNTGYRDYNGDPIRFELHTKKYNLDFPFHSKRIYRLYVAFRQPEHGEDVEIDATVYVDGIEKFSVINEPLRINFVWGDPWGGVWGQAELVTSRRKVSASGHRVQLRIVNDQIDMPTAIYGIAFEFRPKRAKGTRL